MCQEPVGLPKQSTSMSADESVLPAAIELIGSVADKVCAPRRSRTRLCGLALFGRLRQGRKGSGVHRPAASPPLWAPYKPVNRRAKLTPDRRAILTPQMSFETSCGG